VVIFKCNEHDFCKWFAKRLKLIEVTCEVLAKSKEGFMKSNNKYEILYVEIHLHV